MNYEELLTRGMFYTGRSYDYTVQLGSWKTTLSKKLEELELGEF